LLQLEPELQTDPELADIPELEDNSNPTLLEPPRLLQQPIVRPQLQQAQPAIPVPLEFQKVIEKISVTEENPRLWCRRHLASKSVQRTSGKN